MFDSPTAPSTRRELFAEGLSAADIDRAMRRGDLVATHRGVLLPRDAASDLTARCASALRTQHEHAVIFRRTASAVIDLPLTPPEWSDPARLIEVGAPREDLTRVQRGGIRRYLRRIEERDIVVRTGVRVTNPARTLCDLACAEPRGLMVEMLDAAYRDKRCTRDEVLDMTGRFAGLREVRRLRQVVAESREGVDSPGETRARLAICDGGIVVPSVRLEIWDWELDPPILLAVGDLGYWIYMIWIEYDGFEVHGGKRKVFRGDRHKDRWLDGRGWQVIRLTDADVDSPKRFLSHLASSIRHAPARIAALPPTRSPELAAARRALGIDR